MTTMTATVSIPADVATAAEAALRASGQAEMADRVARALNPPAIWAIRGPEDNEGYRTYLGRHGYIDSYTFGSGHDAVLLTQAEKDAYDPQAILAGTDVAHVADDLDMSEEDLRDYITTPDFEDAPTAADGHEAFASGSTELDFCEALTALGERADAMRAA